MLYTIGERNRPMAKTKNPIIHRRDEIRAWFDKCDPKQTQVRDNIKRAVKLIWQRQTIDEQNAEETRDANGIGFSGVDAKFAARIVNWKGMLTERLAFAARKMIRKYAKQLAEMKLAEET